MESEAETSESLIVQARDKNDIDRRKTQCNISTANQEKEHTGFEDELQTDGTKGDEQRKPNPKVGEGNNEYTDGECFLYPPSVEKVACEDNFRQAEDCPKAISDDTKITISKSNDQKEANKKVDTAEEAEEQPIESPGVDAKGKTTSEGVMSTDQELESGLHSKDEVSDTERDNKGILEIDGHIDSIDNFSSLKKETAELPRDPAASPGNFEASVSAADHSEKASSLVAQGPEIKADTEKKKTQRDEVEKMTSSELEDFNMSQTSNLTIDDNKESASEIMKDVQELGISPWESTDTVEEKKDLHEARLDCNLEEASKSLSEKEFEELNGSSDTLKSKVELTYKNIESNTESLGEEIDKDKGKRNEEDTLLSNTTESGNSIKGTPQTVMVKHEPEECTLKEMMMQEGKERENLDETFTLTSDNNGAVEPIEEIASSDLGEANSWVANSKDQQDDVDTLGFRNCDTADIHQDLTAEANLKGTTDFKQSIISLNEDDSCVGDNTIAKEKRCGKEDVGSESQPEEQENQEIEDSSQVKFDDALASEASKNTEFTSSDRKSEVETEKKIVGHGTRVTKEEKIPEIVETEPETQAIQIQEELTESENKENRIASTDKVSNLIENKDKDSVNGEQLLQKFLEDETAEEVYNTKQDTETTSEDVVRERLFNTPEEISEEPYKLPKQQNDKSAPEGSKITNEAIFNVISREHSPQQDDQFKNSIDVSNVVSMSTEKANQAQENYDSSDITELDSERHIRESNNIDVQKERKVSRSNETNGTDIVEDTDKVNNQIQEGNNDPADENQSYFADFEEQGLYGDAEEATATRSTFAGPSFDSMELPERKEAATKVEIYNQENEDANNIKDIASVDECVKPADAVERLDSCTKPAAACEDNVTFVETRKSESGENSMDSTEQCAISTNILLREYDDEDQARCNAKTEILEAEDCVRKSEEEDEVVKEQNFNEEPQCIKKEAIEDDVLNAMMEKEVDDKEFKNTNSYPPQHHDDSSMQGNKVEAPERCGLTDVQEVEELENTRYKESSFDKAEGNQEKVKISQSQNEFTNNGVQVTEAETTTETHHEDPEDGKLYNSNIDLSANLDTNTKSNSIEEENDEKTHAQTSFIEIQETEAFNKEESEESAACFGKQDQKIDEESASVIELNNSVSSKECMRISSKDIQVNEMQEEATIEKQHCSVESDDSSNITESVPSYEIRRVDIAEEKWNSQNIIEVMDQEHETAEACMPTPLTEVEHPIPNKDICTSISSGDIQDSEAQEKEAMDKQIEDLDKTKKEHNAHKGGGKETLPKNESPMNILKEDINAQFSSIEIQKEAKTDEQTCSSEIHETKTVNKEIVNQSSEENDSCSSRNLGEEIAHASTLVKDIESPVPSKDKYTESSSANFQGSELVEETPTEEQHCGAENPEMITNNASSYKDNVAESQIIEEQKDEKPEEQTDSYEICETKAANNEDFATQNSKAADSCSKKQDEEILENTAPSKDENTRISSEEFQASEVKEEVTIDKQQCKPETENKNKDGYSHMVTVMGITTAPENENPTEILENDIKVQSRSFEESKDEKTNEQTCLNETHETKAVESEEIENESSRASASCITKRDREASQASKLTLVEAASHAYKDECTRIPSGEIHDNKVLGEASIDKEQCISKMEDPRNINNGASSYEILGVEPVLINENSMTTVENVGQDINANSHDMEAQKDEYSKQTGSIQFHDIEAVNHKESVNKNSKVSDYAEASIQLMEAETLVPNKEEHTRISREEHEVLEVKEEAMIEKQQCCSETQKGVEFEQENEDFSHMIDVKQAIIAESEKIEVQTGCNETHETEVINNEEIEGQRSEESNPCSGTHDKEIAAATTQEAEGPFPSIHEPTGIFREDIEVKKETVTQDSHMTNAAYSYQIGDVEIVPATEDFIKIVEDMDQDINQSDTIELQKKEKTHEQIESNEIHETQEANNEEILNHCSKDSNFPCGKQDEEIAEASTLVIGAQDLVASNDECTKISSDKINLKEVEEASQLEIQQCDSKTKDPNEMEIRVSSNKFKRVEIVSEHENSLNKVKDVHQDTTAGLNIINVQKDDNTYEQIGFNEIHETEVVNKNKTESQTPEESDIWGGKQDKEIVDASRPIIESENQVPSIDEYTKISSEQLHVRIKEEPTINCLETKDPNKTSDGVSSYHIRGVEIVPGNESSMNIMEDMNQNIHPESDTIEAQKDEITHEQSAPDEIHETHEVNNEEIKSECAQDSDTYNGKQDQHIAEASTSLGEAENPVPSKDECTRISSDKFQLSEIKVPAAIENKQCYSETKDQNKIHDGVSSYKVEGVEHAPENENLLNKVENARQVEKEFELHGDTHSNEKQFIEDDKDIKVQLDSIEVQIVNEKQGKTGFNRNHETENMNYEEVRNRSSKESSSCNEIQDQEITQASIPVIEAENFIPSNNECTSTSCEDIQISEVEEEATIKKQQCNSETEDLNKISNGAYPYENIEPAATKEMHTVELREANSAGDDATDRNIKDHVGNGSIEKAKDAHQIDKENPRDEIECKHDDSQQAIAQEETNDEVKLMHTVQPEDEINMYDKQIIEGIEMPELSKSREVEGSLSFTEYEARKEEEEKTELGVSNSNYIPNLDLQLEQVVEDVTTKDESAMTGPGDLSSDLQRANFPLASETSPESNIYKGSCSQETRNEDECQFLGKEQTNDISGQHDSSSELISESNIEQTSQIIGDIQGPSESFEQIKKQYIQEGRNSEDIDIEKSHKTVNRELMVAENQSKENLEEHKFAMCNPTTTELTEEAIVSNDSKNVEREATKKSCQEALSAEKTQYQVSSMDTMDNASEEPGDKDGNMQDNLQFQKHENQLELIESDKIDESNSQDTLLQGDMSEALDSSRIVEIQQANTRQMFPPHVKELEILSTQAELINNGSELEKDSRDVSLGEINANQSTETLELDYAEREVNFPNPMDVHMNCQEVNRTELSYIFPEHVGEEPVQTASCKHEEIQGTIKPVTEMEAKADETLSEKLVQGTYLSEVEQMYHKVQGLKDEPIKDLMPNQELAEKGWTTGEAAIELEELSSKFEVTSSTSENKTQTQPMNHLDGSSQTILNKNEGQGSKISAEIPNVSPPINSGKSCGPSGNQTETFQQKPEPHGEELTKSDEADQEMHHQLKSSQLIAEEKSLPDFGAHEATRNEDNQDKNTVLPNDPTLARQNMSLDKEEKKVMEEELETSTENNNSPVDGGEAVNATRQGPAEHMDSEEIYQIKDTKEDDIYLLQSIVAEKEHELKGNLDKLSASFQLPEACNVPMERASEELADDIVAIVDTRQLQDDIRDESEEQGKTEACTEKGVSVIESERNGAATLPAKDPIKQNLEEPTMENPSIVNNKSGEHVNQEKSYNDPTETQADSNTLDSTKTLSSNINQEFSAQTSLMVSDKTAQQEQVILHTERKDEGETALVKSKSDEEIPDEHEDSDLKVPLMSEALSDMELKATHKKSHNILSGVGSKVKHSISKVKKAMACTTSQFAPEEVIIKLNKNKNLDKS